MKIRQKSKEHIARLYVFLRTSEHFRIFLTAALFMGISWFFNGIGDPVRATLFYISSIVIATVEAIACLKERFK